MAMYTDNTNKPFQNDVRRSNSGNDVYYNILTVVCGLKGACMYRADK
jgi:hypothetical protein